MKALVLGASGTTGKLVVKQLIERNISTRLLIRESAEFPQELFENHLVETVKGNINELDSFGMNNFVQSCEVLISCLGHNVSLKGLFGHPRYLVLEAIQSLNKAVRNNAKKKVKLILMSTTAYTNTLAGEKKSPGERIIFSLLYSLLPSHRDNANAANFLINGLGKQDEIIEWVAVRPDTLINNDVESDYEICESLLRSPLFNAGETSRINVSHFMAELVTDEELWRKWSFKTPVIYNK